MVSRLMATLLSLMVGLASCEVSSKEVSGIYMDKGFGDTLLMHDDKSYDYLEKLRTGTSGLTSGKWEIKNRKIYFQCDHKPLVGYALKVRPDTSTKNFQIKLLLGDT